MDHPRDHFLARARRAGDQHPAVGRGDLGDHLAQLLGGQRPADQPIGGQGLGAQAAVLAAQAGRLDGPLDHQQQPVGLERLFEELVGPALDGADRGLDVAVAGDHDHRQIAVERLDQVEQLQPVHAPALHPDVEDDQGRLAGANGQQGLFGVGRGSHRIAFIGENAGDEFADVRFIVDDQNVSRHGLSPSLQARSSYARSGI